VSTRALIRLASVLLVVIALASGLVAWVGLAAIEVSTALTPGSAQAVALITTADGALGEARAALSVAADAGDRINQSAEDVAVAVADVAVLTREQIPLALAAVENSLPALVDTAAVIDNTMTALSFLGVPYDPEVPMDEAIEALGDELDGLPEAIAEQGSALDSMVPEILGVGSELELLAGHMEAMTASLDQAQAVIGDYRETVEANASAIDAASALPGLIPWARAAVVVGVLAGIGLGTAGLALAGRVPARPALPLRSQA
jgi:hypothetical protein